MDTSKQNHPKNLRTLHLVLLFAEHLVLAGLSFLITDPVIVLSVFLFYLCLRYVLAGKHFPTDLAIGVLGPVLLVLLRFWTTSMGVGLPLLVLWFASFVVLLVKYWHFLAQRLHLLPARPTSLTREAYDRMLATLAHEIRTPLTIMQTTENVLMEQIPGPLNARQKKFLESIYINTQRLITFSENMLTLLKLERDWKPDTSKAIDLRLLIHQVADAMEPMIRSRNQQIKYTFPSLVSRPKADEAWIRQVLINLIHNASKHTDEEGSILISVTQDDEQVVVTVTDNGRGLLGEERETLFREFYQEDGDFQAYKDGFGLGLSIVRTIIERHHGHVYITSSKQMGTMVSFTLPAEALQ